MPLTSGNATSSLSNSIAASNKESIEERYEIGAHQLKQAKTLHTSTVRGKSNNLRLGLSWKEQKSTAGRVSFGVRSADSQLSSKQQREQEEKAKLAAAKAQNLK